MEKYIEQTEIVIGLVQEAMSDASFEKSKVTGEEMYEAFIKIAEDNQLNVYELLNAVGAIYLAILELAVASVEGE